jgi:hypothetical protein
LLAKSLLALRIKFSCLDTVREISNPKLRDISSLSHQFVDMSEHSKVLCRTLATVWDLGEITLTHLEVKARLHWQLAEINRLLDQIRHGMDVTVSEVLGVGQYMSHDPIISCEAFVSSFNEVADTPDKAWAVCIDEMEIMPAHLQRYLYSCFRSIDHRIVLKLATSPFSGLDWERFDIGRPMPGNDYTPINLGFTRKNETKRNEARRFSARLLDALIAAEGNQRENRANGAQVLGRSPITEANTSADQRDAYRPPAGIHYMRFSRLREIDVAFRQFLDDREIDLEAVHAQEENKRASNVRKYIWQVACRLVYGPTNLFSRRDKSIGGRPPSIKAIPEIYTGLDSLITMCEGNPRTIIGIMRPLVRRYFGTSKQIPYEDQAAMVQEALAKYLSLLSTIRVTDPNGNVDNMSIIDLIEMVGEFYSNQVNGEVFKPEPALTFRVDHFVPKEFVEAIGSAMNQGAFIMLSDESGLFDYGSILGARLRLSYLMCPLYGLPLTLGGVVDLSSILTSKGVRKSNRALTQGTLFGRLSNEK